MTKKRFTWEYSHSDSTGEIIDWIRNECLMTDYLQKYELEEWCQELNKIVDENNQLRKENKQLKESFIEQLESALTLPFIRKEYCNALLRVLDEEDSLESAKEYIKNFLGVSE